MNTKKLFRETEGEHLSHWINKLLGFGRFVNPNTEQQQIHARTVEALKRIAGDSEFKKLRMKKIRLV